MEETIILQNDTLYQDKNDIIEWVKNLTDNEVISRLKFMKEQPSYDWAEDIDIIEKNSILEGLNDMNNQQFVSNSQVKELYEKWL